MKTCPNCKAKTLSSESTEIRHSLGSTEYAVEVPATKCTSCHHEFVSDQELQKAELAISEHSMRFANSAALKFARKSLGLTGADLASLLGIRPETLSRWENGALQPDRAWFAVLATLAAERLQGRNTLEGELRAQADGRTKPRKPPKRVRIAA